MATRVIHDVIPVTLVLTSLVGVVVTRYQYYITKMGSIVQRCGGGTIHLHCIEWHTPLGDGCSRLLLASYYQIPPKVIPMDCPLTPRDS